MRRLALLVALMNLGWGGLIMAPSLVQAEDQVARGQAVYQERCASCHGEPGDSHAHSHTAVSESLLRSFHT
jgi:mono/diheme cytochrome c family protein